MWLPSMFKVSVINCDDFGSNIKLMLLGLNKIPWDVPEEHGRGICLGWGGSLFLPIKFAYRLKSTLILSITLKSLSNPSLHKKCFSPSFHIHMCTTVLYLFGTRNPPPILTLSLFMLLFHVPFHIMSSQKWLFCILSDQVTRECLRKWPTKWAIESKAL